MLFPSESIYLLNIGIIAVILLFAYSGYRQGLMLKLLGICGFAVCGFLAWGLSSPFSKLLKLFPEDLTPLQNTIAGPLFYDSINRAIVFLVLFVLLVIVVIFLKPILKGLGKLPLISEVNTLLGAGVGALQGLLLVMILSFVFATPLFANGTKVIEGSLLQPLNAIGETLLFFAQGHMEELKSVQKIVTPSTALDDEDRANIRNWLLGYGLEESGVNAFMREVAGEQNE